MPSEIDLLNELRDVIQPQDPGLWPPAIGWWVLVILVILTSAGIVRGLKIAIARYSAISIAKRVMEVAVLQPHQAIIELSILMRSVAITKFPRSSVAGLTGEKWLEFLDSSGDTNQFTYGPGRLLITAPYAKNHDVELEPVLEVCHKWVNHVT